MKPLIIVTEVSSIESCTDLVLTIVSNPRSTLGRGPAKWASSGGSNRMAKKAATAIDAATAKKGVLQLPNEASHRPAGTPKTDAAAKPPITTPIARPRRCTGTVSLRMAMVRLVAGPPKQPARTRVSVSVVKLVASPPKSVPTASPTSVKTKAFLRSNRSRKNRPNTPLTEAAAV